MKYKILNERVVYDGFFTMSAYDIEHDCFNVPPIRITRECFNRGRSAAILPYSPCTQEVLLIEQFRAGAVGSSNPWLLEVIAGGVEPGATPLETVKRESLEEAGITAYREIIHITDSWVSPGGSDELASMYVGVMDSLEGYDQALSGLDDEHEDIRCHVMGLDKALIMTNEGQIANHFTLVCLYWLALNQHKISVLQT